MEQRAPPMRKTMTGGGWPNEDPEVVISGGE